MKKMELPKDSSEQDADSTHLAGIYSDICSHFGYEIAKKMHFCYGGQQITFPMKFYDSQYIAEKITEDYVKGMNIKELSGKYNYSERRIRQIVKEAYE